MTKPVTRVPEPDYLPRAVKHKLRIFVVKDYTVENLGFIAFYRKPPRALPDGKISAMIYYPSFRGYLVYGSGKYRNYRKVYDIAPDVLWENPSRKSYNPYYPVLKEFLTEPKNQCIPVV